MYKPVKYNWPWKLPSEEKDEKPVKRGKSSHSKEKHQSAMPEWRLPSSEGHVKPAITDTVTPPVSKATPWPVLSAWKIPVSKQDLKQVRVKPDNVPPLVPIATPVTVVPAMNPGTRSPVLSESVPRYPQYQSAFSSVSCSSQRPSQVMCRSKIIFPPCSCMRPAVCGVRMISDVKSIPVRVITRFV